MKKTFETWSADFKRLKDFKAPTQKEIVLVVDYWKHNPPPPESVRKGWKHPLGFRKNIADGKDRGEQEIERLLLGAKGDIKTIRIEKSKGSTENLKLSVTEQNFPFAAIKKGQVICDAWGYHHSGENFRPVAIEVKVNDGSPWLAVVENLIQVRLARYNLQHIEERGRKALLETPIPREVRGAWGLVVAPPEYYDNSNLQITLQLIERLKEKTEARIMLTQVDKKKMGDLDWYAGYWPRARK